MGGRDYTCTVDTSPLVASISGAPAEPVARGQAVTLTAVVSGGAPGAMNYSWTTNSGSISGQDQAAATLTVESSNALVELIVTDDVGAQAHCNVTVQVSGGTTEVLEVIVHASPVDYTPAVPVLNSIVYFSPGNQRGQLFGSGDPNLVFKWGHAVTMDEQRVEMVDESIPQLEHGTIRQTIRAGWHSVYLEVYHAGESSPFATAFRSFHVN